MTRDALVSISLDHMQMEISRTLISSNPEARSRHAFLMNFKEKSPIAQIFTLMTGTQMLLPRFLNANDNKISFLLVPLLCIQTLPSLIHAIPFNTVQLFSHCLFVIQRLSINEQCAYKATSVCMLNAPFYVTAVSKSLINCFAPPKR